ncbi:unnamed protein product [Fraxinus pennsylvanica]|uniref:Uncharacterized protein n=1 Tax=Fraxinus pennsylvanica TaxID=56036 RepID=A0AAD1Z9L6_9LAMI|nr:unnamed protein product [Fraxinus pennsylvanica]
MICSIEVVEYAFGGKDDAGFYVKYAERMKDDDKRILQFWITDNNPAATSLPAAPRVDPWPPGDDTNFDCSSRTADTIFMFFVLTSPGLEITHLADVLWNPQRNNCLVLLIF